MLYQFVSHENFRTLEGKCNIFPFHAMKVHMGTRSRPPLTLNHDEDGWLNYAPQLLLYHRKITLIYLE